MIELQPDRYLWVHFAGLAAVPLLLDTCLAGLASASPAFGYSAAGSLFFWAIALIGIVPTLWMQLAKPFYVFSLPPFALRPTELTDDQRRCLQLLKSVQIKVISVAVSVLSFWVLWQLYEKSPQVAPVLTPTAGVIVAIASFFCACLFLQISVSAGRSLLVDADTLQRVKPVEQDAITTDFLILGPLRVKQLLPVAAAVDTKTLTEEALIEEAPPEQLLTEQPLPEQPPDQVQERPAGSKRTVEAPEDTDLLPE